MKKMAIITHLVKLKKPTKQKHKQWLSEQQEYANCVNWCVNELKTRKLSSKDVPHELKSAIKNEAIRKAKKALKDFKSKKAKTIPVFKSTTPISINNQNWSVSQTNHRWYMHFTTNEGKLKLPIVEDDFVKTYFHYFTERQFRGTMQLLRKGNNWYVAIPLENSCKIDEKHKGYKPTVAVTPIGVDLGLRHIAVVSEPVSNKRQFFSGKEIGFKRRYFRSLRQSLQKKKALRAVKTLGKKESRWMEDYNRKLAKDIVTFALQFDNPIIKLEKLDDIRKSCKSMKRADRSIHSWAFYQLKQFIKERAVKFDIDVVDINPYKTSQTCFVCKHAEKANRSRDKFLCKNCGHKNHADLNASKNIALA